MADEHILPSLEEIAQLPRWARVAFVARCVRRIQPVLVRKWPKSLKQDLSLVLNLIEHVELSAATAKVAFSVQDQRSVRAAGVRAEAMSKVAGDAAFAVFSSTGAVNVPKNTTAIYVHKADPSIARFLRQDYERIRELCAINRWTDDTPVPPSVFDPLDDEPSAKALVVDMLAPENTDPKVIGESLVKLWEVANEYHMARGGGVLTFDEFRQMMPSLVPVGPKSEG